MSAGHLLGAICGLAAICAALSCISAAQTLTTLASFAGPNGVNPTSAVIQGSDGNFYGTTQSGGTGPACPFTTGCGTVFRVTPGGELTVLYNFCQTDGCTDGAQPYAGLVQDSAGNFYGTTFAGGLGQGCAGMACGTVFELIPSVGGFTLLTVHSFCPQQPCDDGAQPLYGPLILDLAGNLYGTTSSGGTNGAGTIYEIAPGSAGFTFTTLYSFCGVGDCTDGASPAGPLVQGSDGSFYGTTQTGGAQGGGTIFKLTAGSTITFATLYNFCAQLNCTDGQFPIAGLVPAANGQFYGTTSSGGGASNGGTVFSVTPAGALTTLYSFCKLANCSDGSVPYAGLIQAADGNFYGATRQGGNNGCDGPGCGTLFAITPAGMLTTLYTFCTLANCSDGAQPYAGLLQATDGAFYGTTFAGGGAPGDGTVFKLAGALLTVSTSGNGSVTSTDGFINCPPPENCSHFYPLNTMVTLNATPMPGWIFAGWSGNCMGTGDCTVTMTRNLSVTATFIQSQGGDFTISVTPGSVTVTQSFTNNNDPFFAQTINVLASPVDNYNNMVTLTCSVSPPLTGGSCTVNPPSSGSLAGGNLATTLTITAGSDTPICPAYVVTVTGQDPTGLQHSASLNLTVINYAPGITIPPGGGGSTQVTFCGQPANPVTPTCPLVVGTNLNGPQPLGTIGGVCAFTPTSGPVPGTFTSTISGCTVAGLRTHMPIYASLVFGVPGFVLLGSARMGKRSRRKLMRVAILLLLLSAVAMGVACGTGGGPLTPTGHYYVLVQGTGPDGTVYSAVVPVTVRPL